MIGLLVLVVGAIYLAVLVLATRVAYRWAAKKGLSKPKRILVAAGGFLVVYLPVFWDHIPTLVIHKYYCKREAGFWVYKTLEQWKAENPSVMEVLVSNESSQSTRTGDADNYVDTYFLNQRIIKILRHNGKLPLNVWRWEQEIVDTKNGEVLARSQDFSTAQTRQKAGWSGWKIWLATESCNGGSPLNDARFHAFKRQFSGGEK